MILALLPACGKSERMGRPKLSLPLGGKTVLEQVVAAVRTSVSQVLVVLGPASASLLPLVESAGAEALLLAEQTADMRATVEQGLRWLEERHHPGPDDAWLLLPADHPTLSPDVVRQLLEARASQPGATLWVPTFGGKAGHPSLVAWSEVAELRDWPAGQGLNTYFRRPAARRCEVPVDTPEILFDLDTPEDYARLLERTPARVRHS